MDAPTFDFTAVTNKLNEVAEKQKALDAERNAIRDEVLAQCRIYVEMFNFTAKELGAACDAKTAQAKNAQAQSKAKPKYKNPDGEETWSGRGSKKPEWFLKALEAGFTADDMLIEHA